MKKLQISAAFSFVEQKLLLHIYGEGGYEERLRNLDSVYTSLRKKGMSPSDMFCVKPSERRMKKLPLYPQRKV
jgi:hypothetical protein